MLSLIAKCEKKGKPCIHYTFVLNLF